MNRNNISQNVSTVAEQGGISVMRARDRESEIRERQREPKRVWEICPFWQDSAKLQLIAQKNEQEDISIAFSFVHLHQRPMRSNALTFQLIWIRSSTDLTTPMLKAPRNNICKPRGCPCTPQHICYRKWKETQQENVIVHFQDFRKCSRRWEWSNPHVRKEQSPWKQLITSFESLASRSFTVSN